MVGCHCPTTGRIGNLILDGLPCLLSRSHSSTVGLPPPDCEVRGDRELDGIGGADV